MNHFRKIISLAVGYILLNTHVYALEVPAAGKYDERVKFVNYNAAQVVQIVGHYGYSTHIQFNDAESVKNIAMGDSEAWDVAPMKNHIFIKPKGDEANTNMTVITDQRVYNFELNAHWSGNGAHPSPNDMVFQINFKYPEIEQALAESSKVEGHLNSDNKSTNFNYWGKGAEEVSPSAAYDDGRFTYLTFSNNKEMPAIYIKDSDGTESLVNTNIDPKNPDTIVIHKIARQFILRKGRDVTCVFNQSFDLNGITNTTGTVNSEVQRVIKDNKK
ncbi:MAG: P-type conjugative transfer protein VirB9 [Pseudomonadota bacterium]